MRIYFANNKYLTVGSIDQYYHNNIQYLRFDIIDSSLSYCSLYEFLQQPETLKQITLTNEQGIVVEQFVDQFVRIDSIKRTFVNEKFNYQIILTSSETIDTIPFIVMNF